MIGALLRAVGELPTPAFRRILLAAMGWTALGTGGLIVMAALGIHYGLADGGESWIEVPLQVLGLVGDYYMAMWLFPTLAVLVMGLYATDLINAIEARDYPGLPPPVEPHWLVGLWGSIRLVLVALALNLLALPLYLVLPGLNLVLFLTINGYLLARDYFDAVTLRRMEERESRRLWRDHRLSFMLTGAVIALLNLVPFANLIAPMVGLAASVHLVHGLAPPARRPVGST